MCQQQLIGSASQRIVVFIVVLGHHASAGAASAAIPCLRQAQSGGYVKAEGRAIREPEAASKRFEYAMLTDDLPTVAPVARKGPRPVVCAVAAGIVLAAVYAYRQQQEQQLQSQQRHDADPLFQPF